MPALQVRDFPEDLYQQLKEYAAREHRSVAQQTIAFVEQGVCQNAGGYHWDGRVLKRPPQIVDFDMEKSRQHRAEYRSAVFAEIDGLPSLANVEGLPDPAEMVRACRSEQERKAGVVLGLSRG